ncbi:MAG: hypothetical protein L6Q77_12660 [Bacteroidetes bacterium]|nr:hypothetical protein [Bacteroidota bacterium]
MRFFLLFGLLGIFTPVLSQSGTALLLDGSPSSLSTSLDVQPSALPVTTWEAWVYPERTFFGIRQQVLSNDDGNYDRSLLIEAGTDKFAVFVGSGAWQTAPVSVNEWQHIAVVFHPDSTLFYKNGVKYSLGSGTSGMPTGYFLQVGMNPGFGEYFKGKIDEVRIWTVVRSQEQLIAGMSSPPEPDADGLVAWYRMEASGSGSGITLSNSAVTGSVNDGVTTGSPSFGTVSGFPAGIPDQGLRLWLKSDSSVSVSAGKVVSWSDISGTGISLAPAEEPTRPSFLPGTLNGYPVITFDGADDFLQTGSAVSLLGRDSLAITVTLVLKTEPVQSNWANILDYDHDSYSGFTIQQNVGSTNEFFSAASPYVLNTDWQVVSFELVNGPGGFASIRVNGVVVSTASVTSASSFSEPRRLALGRWISYCCNTPGRYWNGSLAEVLIHNRTLTQDEHESLQSYFKGRYETEGLPLPVEMTAFSGSVSNGTLSLAWSTATELHNFGWTVRKKSQLPDSWETLGFVSGKGTTTEPKTYSFSAPVSGPGNQIEICLIQRDLDGTETETGRLILTAESPEKMTVSEAWPNPFNPETQVSVTLAEPSRVRVELVNALGQTVKRDDYSGWSAGVHALKWDGKDQNGHPAASGFYFYRIQAVSLNSGKTENAVRRLVLMK